MADVTPCVRFPNVFLHQLLDDGATPQTVSARREQEMVRAQAASMCAGCPLRASCLSDAVTRFDVAGFVAGTTRAERREIRARLGVDVAAEDFDAVLGVRSGRQYDRYEIQRLRAAHPTLPLSTIAAKLGCSVSTIKRHLRRIEEEGLAPRPPARPAPTPAEVMEAASAVLRGSRRVAAA